MSDSDIFSPAVREQVLKDYAKVMRRKDWLYLRDARTRGERIKKHPFLTLRYAFLDRIWRLVVQVKGTDLLTMRTFWGRKIVMKYPDYRCVLHHGLIDSRELPVEDYLAQNIKPGDVFMDIGANVGFYSAFASALGAKVYAFEPTPETFDILKANVPEATLARKALMAADGQIRFADRGRAHGYNSAVIESGDTHIITVDAATLDGYCRSNGVHPAILKIDVEGAEDMVIRGGEATLMKDRPVLLVETEYKKIENAEVIRHICSLGYEAFTFGRLGEIIPFAESADHSANTLFMPIRH